MKLMTIVSDSLKTIEGARAACRGGRWSDGASSGLFTVSSNPAPTASVTNIGGRWFAVALGARETPWTKVHGVLKAIENRRD